VRHLYLAPAAVLEFNPLPSHHALECSTNPALRLVVVESWPDAQAQDRFEAFPGVLELRPSDYDKPAPQDLVSGFADSKVASITPLDTLESALWKIRAAWGEARH
jgi:hypothetical protein